MKKLLLLTILIVFVSAQGVHAQNQQPVGVLYIPKLGLTESIWFSPIQGKLGPLEDRRHRIGETGVYWLENTAWIDDQNLVVLAGHSTTVFGELDQLEYDDMVIVFDDHTVAIYQVEFLQVVEVDDLEWITQRGESVLRLLTCYGEHRLVVQARRVD